ncbi:MAG TPA: hypothetical protein VFQ60_04025 [Patescibacteria group bacterium]|nr:hypothetical protein [Patescibacteria group bacterium]
MFEWLAGSNDKQVSSFERGEARAHLLDLEATGKYVFHGSDNPNIKALEPRQPQNFPEWDKAEDDGSPCIATARLADAAIFRALVREDRTGFGQDKNEALHLYASRTALKRVARSGYVYVLDRKKFEPRHGSPQDLEWRSEETVTPLEVVRVTKSDLPNSIEIVSERTVKKSP